MNYQTPAEPPLWNVSMPSKLGVEALEKGEVAVVLLAGGLGSRLGWEGPKGTFPITPHRQRTLFQLFADKVEAASFCYGKQIPVAVLTSKAHTQKTREVFKETDFIICEQGELPYLDANHQPLPFTGPDGNGSVFQVLEEQGVLKKWAEKGVKILTTVLIENPLADPVDPIWIDYHLRNGFDLSLKVIQKNGPDEKVGLLVEKDEKIRVVEYSEIEDQGLDRDQLQYANISLFLIDLALAERAAKNTPVLPIHLQWKQIQEGLWGWKQERYIFDHFVSAKKIGALLYEREKTFVPLKGKDDLEKVQKALSRRERQILEALTGNVVDEAVKEIDPTFYYPTPDVKKKWFGKQLEHNPFIDGDEK